MQIVRDLAGYSLGRSDLVRRAMAKKKADVMAKERQVFVYGEENKEHPEKSVAGCVANGISPEIANKIFDEMTDFAKYAFNKSHAAAYAVVAYQTAFLKYYYREEFMAALMTSVIDNTQKVSEYMNTCRQMGIKILPPDINLGENYFTVKDGNIVYALSAIRSVGHGAVLEIVRERKENGPYHSVTDFIERMVGQEVNKRCIENMAKAGAFDSFGDTRKAIVFGFASIMDEIANQKKKQIPNQVSLFDFMGEEEVKTCKATLPKVGEWPKNELLAFEKEVMGIYVSGHPLEEDLSLLQKSITNVSTDFVVDEETGASKIKDGANCILGGMINQVTVKSTKQNKRMAFITLEDMYSTVEVIVFSKLFEHCKMLLTEDKKVFVKGRASISDEPMGKVIAEDIIAFEDLPKNLWIQFETMDEYNEKEHKLYQIIHSFEGHDSVNIFIKSERRYKTLPKSYNVSASQQLQKLLFQEFGEENVKITIKPLEMR